MANHTIKAQGFRKEFLIGTCTDAPVSEMRPSGPAARKALLCRLTNGFVLPYAFLSACLLQPDPRGKRIRTPVWYLMFWFIIVFGLAVAYHKGKGGFTQK